MQTSRQDVDLSTRVALGGGNYRLVDLESKEDLTGSSTLLAALLGFELKYALHFGKYVRIGLKDSLDLQLFSSLGLPEDLDKQMKAQGFDTQNLNLNFGTVDVFNTAFLYIDIGNKPKQSK